MKTLKVTTLNSVYIVTEDGNGERTVTDIIPSGDWRDVHYFIKNQAPDVESGPEIGKMMTGFAWHTSLVTAIDEIPSI